MKKENNKKTNNKPVVQTKAEEKLGNVMVMQVLITVALIILAIIYVMEVEGEFMGAFAEDNMVIEYYLFIGSGIISSIFMISGYKQKDRNAFIIGTIFFAIWPSILIFVPLPKFTLNTRTIISILILIYSVIALIMELTTPKDLKKSNNPKIKNKKR